MSTKDLDQGHQRQPAKGTQHPPCGSLVQTWLIESFTSPRHPPWYKRKYYVKARVLRKSPNYIKFREKGKIWEEGEMVEKIREEGEKWVIKQGEGIFIYLFLSPPLQRREFRPQTTQVTRTRKITYTVPPI